MADFLRIEDAECILPEPMQGDLLIYPELIAFIPFKRSGMGTLQMMFGGLIGFLWRSSKMNKWREGLSGKTVDEMITITPGSWKLNVSDVRKCEKKFPATLILHVNDGQVYRISVPRLPDFKYFAEKHKMSIAASL